MIVTQPGVQGYPAGQQPPPQVIYVQGQPQEPVPVNLTVTVQPEAVQAEQLMPAPQRPPNCPEGLVSCRD